MKLVRRNRSDAELEVETEVLEPRKNGLNHLVDLGIVL